MVRSLIFFVAAVAMTATGLATPARASDTVAVGARNLFIPDGYDNNDQVIVVVDGTLPNTCHQLTTPVIEEDSANATITIDVRAYVNSGNCIPVPVPYELEVNLGTLPARQWQVSVLTTNLAGTLQVNTSSTSGPDDYLYAPVAAVSVSRDDTSGRWSVTLKGDLFSDCLAWQETRVLDQGAVIVLLPILAQTTPDCQTARRPFRETVLLPEGLSPGRHLIHVRSLSGKAVNHIFTVAP